MNNERNRVLMVNKLEIFILKTALEAFRETEIGTRVLDETNKLLSEVTNLQYQNQ